MLRLISTLHRLHRCWVILRDVIILFQALPHRHEVQALKAAQLDNIVLQAPMLRLERDDEVDILKQPRDRVCRGAVRLRDAPQYVGGRQAVALDRKTQSHGWRRVAANNSLEIANFWMETGTGSYDGRSNCFERLAPAEGSRGEKRADTISVSTIEK